MHLETNYLDSQGTKFVNSMCYNSSFRFQFLVTPSSSVANIHTHVLKILLPEGTEVFQTYKAASQTQPQVHLAAL